MSLKKFLSIPLLISLVAFIYFSPTLAESFQTVVNNLEFNVAFFATLLLAALLQICGHLVRARKAELLFSPVKDSTTRFQFRALSIGYLFNALLPFRLGELIRARIIAGGLDISFGFSLCLIIIERAFDALILGCIGVIILIFASNVDTAFIVYVIGLLALAALVFITSSVVVKQNVMLLNLFYRITAVFRDSTKNSLRFKAWSAIYGMQRVLYPKLLIRYIGLSLISWFFYICSTLVVAQYLFAHFSSGSKLLLSSAPYYGVAIPSGPANLGTFSKAMNIVTAPVHLTATDTLMFNLLAWSVLIVPISAIGLILLFFKTKETLWRKAQQPASTNSLINKLRRSEDISQEMSSFLENYFSGNTLSRIVHRLELRNNFRLLKYFKGGSDAITILVLEDGKEIVKKIIPLEFEDRLQAQYEWLAKRKNKPGIVKVLSEERAEDYYAINLEYRKENAMLFEYMHHNPIDKSEKLIDEVWGYLFKEVHKDQGKLQLHPKERDAYVKKHIYGCLEKAGQVDVKLLDAAEPKQIIINGREYDNLYQVMDKIKKHPRAWKDIANYKETGAVHGDVAVDNILVSEKNGHALIIDPAPDGNIINGPVFDFSKNMQSLYCGYEFLLRDGDPVDLLDGRIINYRDHSSSQYTQLCDYVRSELAPKHLSESEQRAMLFHAGALHIRRLKHQVHYNPANALKFYAVGVKTLNDFLAQYE